MIVAAPAQDDPDYDNGNVFIYLGTSGPFPERPSLTLRSPSPQQNAFFGIAIAASGDLNGDGLVDIAVGATGQDAPEMNEGSVFVFSGNTTGEPLLSQMFDNPSNEANARFGTAIVTGDVDGDGFADLIVGANWQHARRGALFVFRGTRGPIADEPYIEIESPTMENGQDFGGTISDAGDVNGDGFGDLIIRGPLPIGSPEAREHILLYLGSAAGPHLVPNQIIQSQNEARSMFGQAIAAAKDINGDGYPDMAIGAYSHDDPSTDNGRAYRYSGTPRGFSESPTATLENPAADENRPEFGRSTG